MKNVLSIAVSLFSLIAVLNPFHAAACTSWMVFSDLTKNGTNILHKNRDATPRNVAVYLNPASSPRKWIGSGNNGGIYMGMNSSGLAVIMNNGEAYVNVQNSTAKNRKTTPIMIRECLEQCDTAAQAVEYFKKIIADKLYYHPSKVGAIYFVCDRNEGYICEMTDNYVSVQKYTEGFTVRANIWQNPGMYQLARNSVKKYLNSSTRAFIALAGLNQIIDKNGKIAMLDLFTLSRHCAMPDNSPSERTSSEAERNTDVLSTLYGTKRSICFKHTNSISSFEIDKQYPDVLSTMYTTVGHPRHTVYVPVPVCVEKLHPAMTDLRWSAASFTRRDKLNLEAPIPAEWTKFEADSMAKYNKAKDEARKLLNAGKRAEAVKLVNSTAEKIWNDAVKLLKI